jgi:ribosomal protein S18 acetylase RimI-like enzyme
VSTLGTRIELAGAERIDDVRELWLHLHHHHRSVAGSLPLVKDGELSWQRRRARYLTRLASGSGLLVLAREADAVVAYAFLFIEDGPDDTFPLGGRYAELYSLSVEPRLRGRGIGTQLLDFVDRELASRSIGGLEVAVMSGNDAARRFYERRGLREAEVVMFRFVGD